MIDAVICGGRMKMAVPYWRVHFIVSVVFRSVLFTGEKNNG
jgi:hypothetical protein